jgi:hypothetical protein
MRIALAASRGDRQGTGQQPNIVNIPDLVNVLLTVEKNNVLMPKASSTKLRNPSPILVVK